MNEAIRIERSGRTKSLLAAVLPLLAACGEPPAEVVAPRVVVAYTVSADAADAGRRYAAEIRARHESPLGFRIGGKLRERRVEVGERVRAGRPLARLEPQDPQAGAEAAAAELRAAEAERRQAAADLERAETLRTGGFLAEAAVESRRLAARAAEERYQALAARAAVARNQAAYAELLAPFDGVVAAVLADEGQVLAAGQPVLRLATLGEPEALVAVAENGLARVRPGTPATIRLWAGGGRSYRGVVRELSAQADPVTRTFAARLRILDADAALRLGMTAHVDFAADRAPDGLLLPAGAVFQQGEQPAVWIIGDGGQLSLRPVTVAAWREDGVLVSAGVAPGERIVGAGAHLLSPGETVRVRDR